MSELRLTDLKRIVADGYSDDACGLMNEIEEFQKQATTPKVGIPVFMTVGVRGRDCYWHVSLTPVLAVAYADFTYLAEATLMRDFCPFDVLEELRTKILKQVPEV